MSNVSLKITHLTGSEITERDKELLKLLANYIDKKIQNENRLLTEIYVAKGDTESPRYYWRKGCIDSLEEVSEQISAITALKYF